MAGCFLSPFTAQDIPLFNFIFSFPGLFSCTDVSCLLIYLFVKFHLCVCVGGGELAGEGFVPCCKNVS